MCRERSYSFWWPVGFLFLMLLIFGGGFKFFMFVWPLFFFLPCLFWFSKRKRYWQHDGWHHGYDDQWEKPKRKTDEMPEKPKREGEIYYF